MYILKYTFRRLLLHILQGFFFYAEVFRKLGISKFRGLGIYYCVQSCKKQKMTTIFNDAKSICNFFHNVHSKRVYTAGIYLFKVNIVNNRTIFQTDSKLTINAVERHVLVSLLLTLVTTVYSASEALKCHQKLFQPTRKVLLKNY